MASSSLPDVSATKEDKISSMVQMQLIENAVIAASLRDVSSEATPGAGSISFPLLEQGFAVQKLSGAQEGDDQEFIVGVEKLDLTEEAHVQWLIKKFDQSKSKISILRTTLENATRVSARQLDQDILDELIPNIDAANLLTGAITQAKIVAMIDAGNVALMPQEDRSWIFGNGSYATLLDLAGFVDASKSNLDIVRTGQIGTLYGYPVFRSDVMVGAESLLVQRGALAYGFSSSPSVEDEKAIKYGTGSRRWVMDSNYGQKTLQAGKLAVHCTGV